VSAAPDDALTPSGLPRTPVSFRLGDLEPEIARRKRVHEGAVATIRRDLTRYYAGARATLHRMQFDFPEADILFQTLRFAKLDASSARFLWAVVDEKVRAKKSTFVEGTQQHERALRLIEQLRSISPLDALAILDAVEIYWDHYENNGEDFAAALEASQLVNEPLLETESEEEP
jgi:hypothetical protein